MIQHPDGRVDVYVGEHAERDARAALDELRAAGRDAQLVVGEGTADAIAELARRARIGGAELEARRRRRKAQRAARKRQR